MPRRLTVGILLVIALVAMASQAPAQMVCGMSMPTTAKMTCGCCATMKSCLLAQKNPAQPAAAVQHIQPAIGMIAPVLHELLTPGIAAPARAVKFATAQPAVHSPPPFVLFCSFLI
ncbi:MAG: hypothetical protein M3007_04360 [Candidatus Eremiobacteraeota bacterium]|nr:hypothetical protein [Candidatus Eremiobacteraeota bacterium]